MVQDKQGFIWFATQDGLNRYDGRNVDHFNFKPFDRQSVSGDDIYSVCLKDNTLFVLNDKGFDLIDLNALNISNLKRKNKSDDKSVFFKNWIFNNELYLLSRNGLALAKILPGNEYDYEYCVFQDSTQKDIKPTVYSVCEDEKNTLFAATSKGIFRKAKEEKNFSLFFPLIKALDFKDESEAYYTAIACRNGKLCFTNSSYLFCTETWSAQDVAQRYFSGSGISSLLIDKQNNIWIGTTSSGIFLCEAGNLSVDKHFVNDGKNRFGLHSNEITCLYQNQDSNDDIVWIGTRDAGAFNYSYSKNSFSIPTSFVNNSDLNFFGVAKDYSGIIWAGFTSGILKIDKNAKTHQIIDLNGLLKRTNRPVEAICVDSTNQVWTAFGNTLYLIDRKKNVLVPKAFPLVPDKANNVSRIVELNAHALLLCTARGIVLYDKKNNSWALATFLTSENKRESIENISAFFQDREKNWWIGTMSGLWCVKKEDGPAIFLRHDNNDPNSILSNRIMDIKQTRKGEILVATTKGLSVIKNLGKDIKNIYSAKGLPNNFIYGLVEDASGKFWMSTNFGLAIFNPENGEFKSYAASDGICINEFNSGGFNKAPDGELLFGGLGGIVSIYPQKQIVNKHVSDIVLRNMKIKDYAGEVKEDKELSLSFGQNNLHFEFSVPDYSGEKNINLFYRFRNKDTSWIMVNPSQLLSLSFIDLAPGKYKLEVIAVNKEGARSLPYTFSFIIGDPFWSTWWFYLILILITVLASWMIYRVRLKRKIAYIQQIEQIRKDENEKVRKAAALDLHDEFGNGLTRISMLIEMIKINIPRDNRDAHNLLDLITQNSGRLYQGTKDFIWSINPGKDNLYEIAIRVKDYADELFHGTNVTFELQGLREDLRHIRQTPTAGRNIAMIFKESLSNVLKHAKASHVCFTVRIDRENIYMILSDNGTGFEMKDYKNSFGINNIQQRANRLTAQININSELNKGTEIVLVLNMNGRHEKKRHESAVAQE
jgi:ligand-binding sensor domain-containing protein/signal transduction histidine kinase